MDQNAPPPVRPTRTDEPGAELERLVREHHAHGRMLYQLQCLLADRNSPARPETVELTSAAPTFADFDRDQSLSIGMLNPTSTTIWMGLDGGKPTAAGRGWPFPPNALMVLPIATWEINVGVDPGDQATAFSGGALVVYVLRFKSVQPAFVGDLV